MALNYTLATQVSATDSSKLKFTSRSFCSSVGDSHFITNNVGKALFIIISTTIFYDTLA